MEKEMEEGAKLERFVEWAGELGITDSSSQNPTPLFSHSLFLAHFPHAGGRGLAAGRDLRKGELILRVPKSGLMSRDTLMMKDHTLSLAVPKFPSLSSTQILAVALLNEVGKGKNSCWYPYLMQLPRCYDTLASFGSFETQALQVDDAIWAAEKAVGKAELEHKDAISLMEELKLKPQLLTFKAWLWASATISSRTLHVPWDDAGCLCPVGDLFNYVAPGEEPFNSEDMRSLRNSPFPQVNFWDTRERSDEDAEQLDSNLLRLTDGEYDEDVGAYCFYARQNYRKADQVLLSYGTYTNLELLEHYGFLLNENQNDKAFIPLVPDVYSLCRWPKDSLYIHENGEPSFALLSAMRLWATPPNQRRSLGHLAYSGSHVSVANEIIVMEWIAKNCHNILKKMFTSIQEDELLLCIIDKMHDSHEPEELHEVVSPIRSEICAFLETNGTVTCGTGGKWHLCRKGKRAMDRWKLAVLWRLKYKKILIDCISYCNQMINDLSFQNHSTFRTNRSSYQT